MKAEKRNKNEDKTKRFDEKEKINEVLLDFHQFFSIFEPTLFVFLLAVLQTPPRKQSACQTPAGARLTTTVAESIQVGVQSMFS